MSTHPSAAEVVQAIAQWIESLRPTLDAHNAYLARVAINGLAIVGRESEQLVATEKEIATQLATLLGHGGDYDALIAELCELLRSGRMNLHTPQLLSILRADTLARLAVDQPNYRHE
jgi:hypothetical protein